MAASWIVAALVVTTFRIGVEAAMAALAVIAVGLYYWFVAPVAASTLGAGMRGATVIRTLAALLLVVWVGRSRADQR